MGAPFLMEKKRRLREVTAQARTRRKELSDVALDKRLILMISIGEAATPYLRMFDIEEDARCKTSALRIGRGASKNRDAVAEFLSPSGTFGSSN